MAGAAVLLAVPIVLVGVYRNVNREPTAAAGPLGSVESALDAAAPGALPSAPGVLPTVTSGAPAASGRPSAGGPSGVRPSGVGGPSVSASTAGAAPKPSVTGKPNPSGANLALQGTATASASEGDPWQPANAIDGDPSSRWSSGFSDDQWIRVDLGGNWQISEIVLVWEHAYGTAYRVETSRDGMAWTRAYATTTGTGGTVRIAEKSVARYVRMHGTKRVSIYGYSLLEFEIR
ncbi:discoidin domain-containing protein [Actinoplanes sichuanensis]|uniref:Discoidin domain-containing protein n=1 Tax=Actinoplanes sichuanensis TaxID=512349 RepID=A0ABW4AC95_9ACTN|nr:discoidin domain-containing protein [Actinoplanes sichuanensis]